MKEMMKQKMMNKFHKRNSSSSSSVDFKSGERLEFKFSSLQALQVPTGWDKLSLSLISIESDKTVSKTGKASVCNGNCRWTETLSESIWVSHDDASKDLQQCLYKLLISKGSTRSSILGEVTVNLSSYLSSETSLPVALPLKKCDHGTILQVAIQCSTPQATLRWRGTNSLTEDVNSDYSDLDNMSPDGKSTRSVGSSKSNNNLDTSHARGLGSRASLSKMRSHRSFDSMDDSFRGESSRSNLSEAAIDLIGRPESTGSQSSTLYTSVNVYSSPRSNHSPSSLGSGKNIPNRRQDSGKVSNTVPASPLRSFGSSDFVMEAEATTPEDVRAEARKWERDARKLMVDLDLSRKVTNDQTKNLENATMELSTLKTECNDLKHEIKHLKALLGESAMKESDADDLKAQVQDKKDIQAELEEEIKFMKDLNNTLALQLNKTQESNLELVSVLQELEETIEKQRLEIKSLSDYENGHVEDPETDLLKQVESNDGWKLELELQKFQESQKKLESTIFYLEKTLEEKTREIELERNLKTQTLLDSELEWTEKLSLKDKDILNLEAKLSQALAEPILKETKSWGVENPDLVEEVKSLKAKILELERDCNELTDENLDLLFKLKESSKDLSTSGTSINSLQGERPSTESPNAEDSEVGNLECRTWQFKEDAKKMKPDLQIRCKDLESKCIELEVQMQGFKNRACYLDSELEKYQEKAREQESEIAALNQLLKQRQEEQNANSFNQEEQAAVVLDNVTKRNKSLESFCVPEDNIQSGEEEIKLTLKDSYHVKNEVDDSLKDNDSRLENLIKELQSRVKDMDEELLAKTSETQGLRADCLLKEEEIQSQKYRQRDLEAQLSDLQVVNSQLEENLKLMQREVDDTKDNFFKLSKKLEDLEEKLSSMLDGIASKEKMLDSEVDTLHLQFKEHKEKYVSAESLLNQMYSEKVAEVENLQQKVEHLSSQISATHDERDVMAKEAILEMHVLRADKDKLDNAIAEVEGKLRSSEKKLNSVQVEYEKRILDLTDELATSKQNHGVLVANHEKLMELLENTRSSEEKLKNTVSELAANLKSCEYEKAQFTEENLSLKVQLQKIPVLQDEIVALKNSLNDVKYENERLEASLQMISGDYQQLKEEKASLLEKAVIELEDHKRNNIALEEKLLCLQGDLTAREALGAQDAELKTELGHLKRSNSQLQWKINRLQEEKDEYTKTKQALEEQKENEFAIKKMAPNVESDSTSGLNEDIKLAEDVIAGTVDEPSRIQSLEIALAEALEANEMYKLQLKSFMSEGKVDESDNGVELEVKDEATKHDDSALEAELNELQERYLNMSLKYAEVEAQREELVLKLKAVGPGRSWFS